MNEVAKRENVERMPWNPPTLTPIQQMLQMVERVAMSPDLPMEKLERMLVLQERVMAQQFKAEYAEAKAAAMAEMPDIPMSGKGHNGRPYSTLRDISSTARPVLGKHGLSLGFVPRIEGSEVFIAAKLMHRNGFEEVVEIPLPFDTTGNKNPVQARGSSITYGERYTAQAILGLSLGEDTEDDGKASGRPPTTVTPDFRDEQHDGLNTGVKGVVYPPNATPADKARLSAEGIIKAFADAKTEKGLEGVWSRNERVIDRLRDSYRADYENVLDAYNAGLARVRESADA